MTEQRPPERPDAVEPRFNRVLDYIDDHIADAIQLDGLANLASYSRFHFIRAFDACFGETPYEFIRRRRIALAASRLRFSVHEPINSVAVSCGFSSQETLARAFRQAYAMNATEWRHGGWRFGQLQAAPAIAPCAVGAVKVAHRDEQRLLYVRVRGRYEDVVPQAWGFFSAALRQLGVQPMAWLGMGMDDPGLTPPSQCRFDVCAVLSPEQAQLLDNKPLPGLGHRASWKRFVGGLYAEMQCRGVSGASSSAWEYLLSAWLPTSGYSVGVGNFCEAFAAGSSFNGEDHPKQLLMPVRLRRQS